MWSEMWKRGGKDPLYKILEVEHSNDESVIRRKQRRVIR